ncbi:MAG: hypothetical protein JST22_01505 [Bacteroidetes bacterium]|nr:hypothetical protein [Bacteroidota bacterium]
MRRSTLHIILCLLLSALYAAEPGLPCVDHDCRVARTSERDGIERAGSAVDRQGDAHHRESGRGSQHCDHCACACHIPALATQCRIAFIWHSTSVRYMPRACNPPTAAINPPDHIPLV